MAVSIPTQATINVVSSTSDYSAKSNLKESSGSFLTQATQLVYDDIRRFQTSSQGYFTQAQLDDFKYHAFEGNVLWFMDELVGIESDWKKRASASSTTAYGYVQFTEDSVETAVNRYIGHLDRFNARKDTRGWSPYGVPLGIFVTPFFVSNLKKKIDNGTYNHEADLDALTYDQQLALAFVHLHSKTSRDSNFRLLSFGDVAAAKELYTRNHHTNPDAATLNRLTGFFKVHYKTAQETTIQLKDVLPGALLADSILTQLETSKYKGIIDAVKLRFGW
jgi:hypothetical protein